MKKILIVFVIFFTINPSTFGEKLITHEAENKIKTSALSKENEQTKLDQFLIKKMKKAHLIGMQVAYISDGQFIWQGNYGTKEYGAEDIVNDSTLFMIASCSKPVTALGVLKLVDQGKVNLDKPINHYLPFEVVNPNFPEAVITVRMLLAHVSSIRDNWDILRPLYTLENGGGDSPLVLGKFLEQYLVKGGEYYYSSENFWTKDPATLFQYSNVGYALLGLIIENVSQLSFRAYMAKEIFKPLEMNESYWFLKDIPHDNIAHPHDIPGKDNDFTEPKALPHYGYPDYPDGQLRMTASDYARFIKVIVNEGEVDGKQFVKKEIIQEFLRIQYPEIFKHQAIAWNYNEYDNWIYYLLMPRLPSHSGIDPGVATAVSFDPKTKAGVVLFTNSIPTKFLDKKVFYQEIMKRLLKEAKKK